MNKRKKFTLNPEADEVATVEEIGFEDDLREFDYLSQHIERDELFGEDEFDGELDFDERR